jgi:hypothetical protein
MPFIMGMGAGVATAGATGCAGVAGVVVVDVVVVVVAGGAACWHPTKTIPANMRLNAIRYLMILPKE